MVVKYAKDVPIGTFDVLYDELQYGAYYVPCIRTGTTCLGTKRDDESKLAHKTKVVCFRDEDCKDSVGATLMGLASGLAYVARCCVHNAHNALCNRHGIAAPPVLVDLNYARELCAIFRRALEVDIEGMTELEDSWLAKWPEGRRKAFLRSKWKDDVYFGMVKSFVKREIASALLKKARLIQGLATLHTQLILGPTFYAIQKILGAHVRSLEAPGGIDVTFGSGLNSRDYGDWMKRALDRGFTTFVERDGKAWDATMQLEHFKLRRFVYEPAGREFLKCVDEGFAVRGTVYGKWGGFLSYFLYGTVKSGHSDTTLGNNIVNAALAYQTLRHFGLRGSILVAGDDLLIAVEPNDVTAERWAEYETKCGINPELAIYSSPLDVSFVSGIFIPSKGSYVFVPKVGRLLARLAWTCNPPKPGAENAWRKGVALGLIGSCGSLPLIRVIVNKWAAYSCTALDDDADKWRHSAYVGIDLALDFEECLDWFVKRYGVTASEVLDCEDFLAKCPLIGVVKHPLIDHVMGIDMADAPDRWPSYTHCDC